MAYVDVSKKKKKDWNPVEDWSKEYDSWKSHLQEQAKLEDLKAEKDAEDKKKAEDNKSILEKAGDIAGGVGKAIADPFERVGQSVGELVYDITGGNKKEQEAYDKAQAESQDIVIKAIKNSKDESKSAEERARWSKLAETTRKNMDEAYARRTGRIEETSEKMDATKTAAAIGDIGFTVLTAGTGSAAVQLTKAGLKTAAKEATKEGAKQVLKQTGKELLKKTAIGAGQGAVAGGLATVEDKGSETNLGDIVKGAGMGAAFGGAIPLAGAGVTKLVGSKPVKVLEDVITSNASKAISKVGETKAGQAVTKVVGDVSEKVEQAFIDTLAPVKRDFKGLVDKATGRQVNEEIRMLQGNVTNASAVAAGRRSENEAWQELGDLLAPDATAPGSLRSARKEAKSIGEFISAKQDAINAQKLGKEGVEVPLGTPKQERAYELLNKATKSEIQYAFDNNLITKANYEKYMADPNYTRVQRDMEDEIQRSFKGVGGPDASISSTPFQQRLKGDGGKKAVDPLVSYVEWSEKVTRAAERQKLSDYIIKQREAHGLGKGYLREADSVEARLAARGEAAQLRVLRNGLSRAVKSESRYGRRLQAELDKLNKQGLNVALKKGGQEAMPNFSVDGLGGKNPTGKVVGVTEPKLGKQDTSRFVKNLIDAPISDLEKIKRKIATREPKLAAHIDNIIGLKNEHEIVSKTVRELNDLARSYADKNMVGKNTIKTFKRGIKEVWEDEPRIVNAINRVGKVELHALMRIAQFPSRVVQRSATALNVAFGIKNFGRDQLSSFLLSKNVRATHNPISFMMGLKEAALKPTAKALLRGVGMRETAEKVLNPSKEYQAFLKYVSGQTQVNITQSMKKAARTTYEELGLKNESFLRKLENVNAATENSTRFQNFYGTLKDNMKKGDDYETALKKAVQAGRENSVDFSQSGDWAPILKIMNPFANANIQGSRSLLRAFKERPIGTSMKVGVTLYTPLALATYYNLSDPQRALIYSALPESTREGNLVFITSDGGVVKLPMPPGAKELAQPVRRMIEAEYGYGDKETFANTAKSLFVDAFNPFGASDIVPQGAKPAVENMANYSFFGKSPIVPGYMEGRSPEGQVYSTTGQTYRDIGGAMGTSPLMVKNIVKGYGGPSVEQGVAYFDKLRQQFDPNVVAEKRTTEDQLKKSYMENQPDLQQKANNLFYEKYNKLSKQRQSIASEIKQLRSNNKLAESNRKAEEFNKTLSSKFSGIEKYGWDKDWDEMLVRLFIKPANK